MSTQDRARAAVERAMPADGLSEWRESVHAELRGVEARISELEWKKRARSQLEAELRAGRDRRRADRQRAIRSLGGPTRAVDICAAARAGSAVRPKRCPGCGVAVVDPRGVSAEEIEARLGTASGWLARADGLLATRECVALAATRRRRRLLGTIAGTLGAVIYVLALQLIVER